MAVTSPFPYDVPVSPETTDPKTGKKVRSPYLSQEIVDWLLEQQQRSESAAEQLGSVSLTGQGAAISATPVPMPDLTAGLYRVSYYARITTAAVTSSSLTITIGWTDGAITMSQAGAAITGNTTATQQNGTFFFRNDANASITYTTTYASNGAGEMKYSLYVVVEAVLT